MIVPIISLLVGAILLYFGAEALVAGASRLAILLGIPPLVVGLTVVSLCTSLPEAVASLTAQLSDNLGDMALANIIGSNISNIALILGCTVIIAPLTVHRFILTREIPVMLLFTGLLIGIMYLGDIQRSSGFFLLGCLVAYIIFQYFLGRSNPGTEEDVHAIDGPFEFYGSTAKSLALLLILGTTALVVGGYLLVDGAVALAHFWGISERVIGLTLVALGTSLPELATSVVAASRGNSDISLGNIVGSNIFNILFIVGGVAAIQPIQFDLSAMLTDAWVMAGYSVLLLVLILPKLHIGRTAGICLFGSYSYYVYTLFA